MKRIFLLSVSSQLNGYLSDWLNNQPPGWLFFETLNTDEILPFPGKNKSIGVLLDQSIDTNTWANNRELLSFAKEAGFIRVLIADNESLTFFAGYFDLTLSSILGKETIINILKGITGIENGQTIMEVTSSEIEQDLLSKTHRRVFFRRKIDASWTMTSVSDLFESLTGFAREEVISGRKINFADLVPPTDRDIVIKKIKNAVNKNKPYQVEYRIKCADSTVKWIWEQGRAIENTADNEVVTEGFMFDNTEKKLAEEEISRLLQAVEQNPNPVVFTNPEGIVVYANHGITDVTGYSPAEFTGRLINILNPEKNDPENVKLIFNTLRKESDWHSEFYNWKKNGQRYWENSFLTPIKDKVGEITHFAYIIDDITKRKHIEKVLVEAKEKAEESDKLKTAFLANMSHEIRIPMNAIIGFTEMLTEKDYSEEEKNKFIELVLENGRKLLSTIDDVIDIAKIEAGQLSISTHRCSANKILFDNFYIFKQMSQKLGKTHLDLRAVQYIPDQNMLFISDPQRINQVISNLMSNALKYTHEGFVELGYRLTPFRESQYLEFYVKDSGAGIPSNQTEQIFNRFRRIDDQQKSGVSGTGLGLAISRNIARLMGGEIILESEPGKGSTFRFMIPFYEIKPELISAPVTETRRDDKPDWSNRNVMIAEDEDSNFKLLEIMLRKSNVKVLRAYNGKQAVDYVSSGKEIDLILMDVKMPVMDGYEATARIKDLKPEIPIVVQTAFALAGDREMSFDAGCDDYLSKPIKATELYSILKKFLS